MNNETIERAAKMLALLNYKSNSIRDGYCHSCAGRGSGSSVTAIEASNLYESRINLCFECMASVYQRAAELRCEEMAIAKGGKA